MMVMCRPLSRRLLGAMVSDASSSAVSCGPAVDAGYECVGWSTLPVITHHAVFKQRPLHWVLRGMLELATANITWQLDECYLQRLRAASLQIIRKIKSVCSFTTSQLAAP